MSNLVASAAKPGTNSNAPANTTTNTNNNTNTESGHSKDKPPVAELNLDLDEEGNLSIPTQRESFLRVPYIHAPISAGIPSALPNTSLFSASERRLNSLTGGLFLSPSPNLNLSPGTFPLVIQTPQDGGVRKQIEVPHTATVADIKWKLANEFGIQNATLVFDDKALNNDQATLEEYNIPSAYDVAGGMLWAIEEGNLNASEKIMALDPALAIIEGIRKGEVNLDDFSAKNSSGGAGHNHKGDESNRASSLPPLPSHHNHSDMGSQETASNQKAAADATASVSLSKSADGRTSPIDYPQVVAKLNEKLPNLYKKDAVNALTNAWSSHDPLAMPPSSLPRFESGGWLDDKLPSVTGTTPIISGSSAENSTPTWLEQISRNWQQSTVERILSNNEIKHVDGSDKNGGEGEGEGEEEGSGNGGDAGDDLGNKTGEKNDEDDEDDDDEEFDEDDDESGSGSENSGSKYTQGNTGSGAGDEAGKDNNDPNVRRPKKRGRKRKYPEMTEEQRAELRKKQNRESAKKSRQRKKKMSQQYEEMIQNVMQENRDLKDQLSALGKRLEMMQQLLTVHVVQDSAAPVPQSAYRGSNMLNPPQWRGNVMPQQSSQPPSQPRPTR
eukprot:CAMPEP_0184692500 /NCGR_PEP_ID=MMETSP0313-20130426/958_1 /TAXON_ID=2792 /ORGANISM="Porphyridium aerugineum, Strain SAG 1380-2" /LENGTH=611 /DNA_ID=CAMNT_0027150335 /DNA_START=569 /DNA_END=2404 /DNA_ORIENTATION=+